MEHPVAELAGLVVVHRSQENHHLPDDLPAIHTGVPLLRRQELAELFLGFHKGRNILRFHPKHRGIAFRQHLGLVLPQLGGREVLPHQVLFLHDVAIADDIADRAVQGIEKAVHMGRDMPPGASGTQLDDLHRPCSGKPHAARSPSICV